MKRKSFGGVLERLEQRILGASYASAWERMKLYTHAFTYLPFSSPPDAVLEISSIFNKLPGNSYPLLCFLCQFASLRRGFSEFSSPLIAFQRSMEPLKVLQSSLATLKARNLDDFDMPSLLRPCKRHQSQQSQLFLDSIPNPNIPSQHCTPTLPPPADNQPPRSLISGPASDIYAAMHHIGEGKEDSRNRDFMISTQDYVWRVEEDEVEEFTGDH